MQSNQSNETLIGAFASIGAYLLWGVLPIYWKLITDASAQEILAHRIFWSFIFMIVVVLISRNTKRMRFDIQGLLADRKRLWILIGASVIITANWFTFIWAVNHGHVVQASLGYYINPLVSVLLGIIFLKEKLSMWQTISCILAFIGVLIMAIHTGTVPWISLGLAITFGLYGLLKKTVQLPAMTGLTLETSIMTPVALIYLIFFQSDTLAPFTASPSQGVLLIGTGIVTAIPLLLFAAGANRISLSMIGFFQYIAPTIMLFLGVLLYHEPFNQRDLVAFILIWASLVLFTLSQTRWLKNLEDKLRHKRTTGEHAHKTM